MSLNLDDFALDVPEALIAQEPKANRIESRLLCYDSHTARVSHHMFYNIIEHVRAGDLLVFNDTRVVKARLIGHKPTGGRVELLFERFLSSDLFLCHIKTRKPLEKGERILLSEQVTIEMQEKIGSLCSCRILGGVDLFELMARCGQVPLPPYIKRPAVESDLERYQTVYARTLGAVAAPTAGLHFDTALLKTLKTLGVGLDFLTLHVGAGTFQPIRVKTIEMHEMHKEFVEVGAPLCERIEKTKQEGGRVIAVGTTVVRALETASLQGRLAPYRGDTDIFIYPGFRFKVIEAMITNFHVPSGTPILLVAAFVGKTTLLDLYRQAIAEKYRFFSYGDAMFLV